MLRTSGCTMLTLRSPMRISPPGHGSRPAILERSVGLPQPDGPSRSRNPLSASSMLTVWRSSRVRYSLRLLGTESVAIDLTLDGAGGDAGDHDALYDGEQNDHRQDGDHPACGQHPPWQLELAHHQLQPDRPGTRALACRQHEGEE